MSSGGSNEIRHLNWSTHLSEPDFFLSIASLHVEGTVHIVFAVKDGADHVVSSVLAMEIAIFKFAFGPAAIGPRISAYRIEIS